jgi:hypothetical protein
MAALSVGGAGCTARSLVQLEMDVQGDPAAVDMSSAKLRILVKQGETTIRQAEPAIDHLADWPTAHPKVGVFLGADVSGQVSIIITIIDKQKCTIGHTDQVIVVDVKPGQVSSVASITIIITEPICPVSDDAGMPPAEAGVDAGGAPSEDALISSDDGNAPEAEGMADAGAATDVYCPPEAGTDAPMPPTCDQFCNAATTNCPQYFPQPDQCMETCMKWRPGMLSTSMDNGLGENTIGCRLWFVTHILPNAVDRYCQNATENSPVCK